MALPLANILQPLIDLFKAIMVFFHDHLVASWGLSIILLTVVIRAALIPLTLKQFRSMQEIQRHQPEIKKLQERYKDDKQRLNQEMMCFYQEHNINPLASCLPLAAQLPVFISLFYMLRHDLRHEICGQTAKPCEQVDPGSAKFLFIPDLTNKATGAVLVTLLILYIGSQLLSSLLMMTSTADKTQRNLMVVLPLVFATFVVSFPAGLVVYWITTNFWTIVQQWIVKRRVGPMQPAAAGTGAGGGSSGGGAGGSAVGGGNGAPASGGGGLLGRLRDVAAPVATAQKDPPAAAQKEKQKPAVNGRSGGAPPPPPRRKKKRSGRRR